MNARAIDPRGETAADAGDETTDSQFDALLKKDAGHADAAHRGAAAGLRIDGARIATIATVDQDGAVTVALPGWQTPVQARLAAPLSRHHLIAAAASSQPVVLVFEDADSRKPLIVGLVQGAASDAPSTVIEAAVDGQRVRIAAGDEIVLQCGEASITLRRNGRVVIRGTHVESASEGTNRIKGGQVRIN